MKRVCVFCGSSMGGRAVYREAAVALGQELLRRDLGLVYGGASVGLMGVVADTVLDGGGEVIGVIPKGLDRKEVMHTGLTEQHRVKSMHERKALMNELSDAFIALPGGWGTLDEMIETLTWAQLGIHTHPAGFLNIEGYFDGLMAFLQKSVEERFVKPEHHQMILAEPTPAALLDRFQTYEAPVLKKWIGPEES